VKLLDFGLVRRAGARQGDALITTPGLLTGTPAYMSPEQASGDSHLDERSDIYSLGAVAYYLLTGQPPFVRPTSMHVLVAHVQDQPSPPSRHRPDIQPDIDAVILRCLAKDRAARYEDVQSLDLALGACRDSGEWTEVHAELWWLSQEYTGSPLEQARATEVH
jgi:serine/threonine-protein kinase